MLLGPQFFACLFIHLLCRTLCVCAFWRKCFYFWKHWNFLNTNYNKEDKRASKHMYIQARTVFSAQSLLFLKQFSEAVSMPNYSSNPLNILRKCQQLSIMLSQTYLTICIFGLHLIYFCVVSLSPPHNFWAQISRGCSSAPGPLSEPWAARCSQQPACSTWSALHFHVETRRALCGWTNIKHSSTTWLTFKERASITFMWHFKEEVI